MLGPEALADTLRNCGADVAGGPKFVTAALALRQHPESGDVFPLIVVRQDASGFDRWLDKHAGQTRVAYFGESAPGNTRPISPGDRLTDVCRDLGLGLDIDATIVFDESGDVTVAEPAAWERPAAPPVDLQAEPPTQPVAVIDDSTMKSHTSSPSARAGTAPTAHRDSVGSQGATTGSGSPQSPAPTPSVGWSGPNSFSNSDMSHHVTPASNDHLANESLRLPQTPGATPSHTQPRADRESLVAGDYETDNHTAPDELFEGDDPYVDRRRGQMGDLLIPYARKGGVGKTSMALALANRAADRGLRTILIDGNRGQGDLRSILRLMKNRMPSIFDSAVSGDYSSCIIAPKTLNQYRPDALEEVNFAFVSAPPVSELTDPTIVTAEVYRKVVAEARARADLVIFDTQIVEAHDTTGIIERLVIPELRAGAWGLGLCDLSLSGLKNLVEYNKSLMSRHGVRRDHLLLALNRIFSETPYREDVMQSNLSPGGIFLGAVLVDPTITDLINRGHIPGDSSVFDEMLDAILHRVTGREAFDPEILAARAAAAAQPAKKKRGFLGFGKKG